MTILAIPNIIILKAVNINVQAIGIHVHVNHEKCAKCLPKHHCPDFCKKKQLNIIRDLESPPAPSTNLIYFLIKNTSTLPQAVTDGNLKNIFKAPWLASLNRRTKQSDNHIIIKKAPQVQRILVLRTQGAKFQGEN